VFPFADAFDDPGSGWGKSAADSGGKDYRDGDYALWANKSGYAYWAWAPLAGQCPETFVVETTAYVFSGGSEANCGIVWGLNNENYYTFQVRADGSYVVTWYKDDKWQGQPIPVTQSAAIARDALPNTLRLVVSGDQAALEVNGVRLGTITLAMQGPYSVGVYGGSGEFVPAELRFTEFSVSVP
jgi:hypothetical protein